MIDGSSIEGSETVSNPDPWLKLDTAAAEVKATHQPVDYQKIIGDARVLFLGERHSNHPIREHIATHASDLKRAGITHYAIEASEQGNDEFANLNEGKAVD